MAVYFIRVDEEGATYLTDEASDGCRKVELSEEDFEAAQEAQATLARIDELVADQLGKQP